ncbi:MAG: polysaccharide biosynthesis protein [Clostridiales bacterium]|nr:polysaccharide biosynthesis protein [Clostridiales bacterium]
MKKVLTYLADKHYFRGYLRRLLLVLVDICCFAVADFVYFVLSDQASFGTPVSDHAIYVYNSIVLLVWLFIFRFVFKLYSNVWRYTNTEAYFKMVIADGLGAVCAVFFSRFVMMSFVSEFYIGIWHGVTITAFTLLLTLLSRFAYRLIYKNLNRRDRRNEANIEKTNVAIVGAGQLGVFLANELRENPRSQYKPVCFIDVDEVKIGGNVAGLGVYDSNDIGVISKLDITEVIIAIYNLSTEKRQELYNTYNELGCKVKVYASPIGEKTTNEAGEKKKLIVRDFTIEDLLFRKPVEMDTKLVYDYYTNKTVLVTGGGGSIGSELCRQIAKCSPKKLIIFDIYENNAYDIQQELIRKYPELDLCVEIGSVRDIDRIDCVFAHYRPDVVFHAAAHKHVPFMEHSNAEAIKNNVLGTYNTANAAEKYGTGKFILVSTDKAVNPTNVMGASKRMCEMVIQCRTDSKTSFAAVRFGNVLGSNGSVIPLFKRQIAEGGPITITDKRIIRYFMTIPEASSLVITAGAMAKKGELFVLDMGKPVKIYDLAVSMIRLMGYEPGVDIEVKEIGLRPGEKLYEELLIKTEDLSKTENDMIFIEKDTPYTREQVEEKLSILRRAVESAKTQIAAASVKTAMKQVVPTFFEPEEINKKAQEAEEMKMMKETT